jgi:hypothetical protein
MAALQFSFSGPPDYDAVEADVTLAVFAAEQIYGKPRTRLEVGYTIAADGQSCRLTTSGEAGDAAARIFAGLTATRLGELCYSVRALAPAVAP